MSSSRTEVLICPDCSHTQKARVWGTLNSTVTPGMKDKLFNDKINVFRCKRCKSENLITATLLYHDMEKEFAVWFFPFPWLEEEGGLQYFNNDGTQNLGEEEYIMDVMPDYLANPHIVFDMEEMKRYITFRDILFERSQNQVPKP